MDLYFTSLAPLQVITLCNHVVLVSPEQLGYRGLHYGFSMEALLTIQIFLKFIFEGKIDKVYFPFNSKEQFYRDEVKTG